MANRALSQAIMLATALTVWWGQAETAMADDHVIVRVRVENLADVPPGVLGGARDDATRIYRAAGIEVVWLTRDEPAVGSVIRVVLPSVKGADEYLRLEHVDRHAL